MHPPENLNNIHIYNLIIPFPPKKNCNFTVTVSYKSCYSLARTSSDTASICADSAYIYYRTKWSCLTLQ